MTLHHKAPVDLARMAIHTRELFEGLLGNALGHQQTLGTCLYASVLCTVIINKFTDATAVVRGGDGEADGGLFIDWVGHGHYWVEAQIGDEVFVVDITADQFGLPKVIVSPLDDLPARYIPGDQPGVDEAATELRLEIEAESAGR